MAQAKLIPFKQLPFNLMTAGYTALGSPLENSVRIIKLLNTTTVDLVVSTDGVNDMIYLPAESFVLYDVSANVQPIKVSDNLRFAKGTQFYVKYVSAPAAGSVVLEALYAQGD